MRQLLISPIINDDIAFHQHNFYAVLFAPCFSQKHRRLCDMTLMLSEPSQRKTCISLVRIQEEETRRRICSTKSYKVRQLWNSMMCGMRSMKRKKIFRRRKKLRCRKCKKGKSKYRAVGRSKRTKIPPL